jgi:predicted lipid-binding transport protein (Tim44 family)
MKAIFGVVSLLVVLAIVGLIAKGPWRAVDGRNATRNAEAASLAAVPAADPGNRDSPTVSEQARSMQQEAREDVVHALEQGKERNDSAER